MSESLLLQAITAHRSNNLVEAERLYLAALVEQPNRADARYNLGMIYGQNNRPVDALREVLKAIEIKPDFGEAWFMLCEFADQLGEYDLNLKAGEQAVQLLPAMPRAWLRYGLALSRVERDDEATAAYRRAVELDPSLANAWVNLSYSLKAGGQSQEAEIAIRKAIEVSGSIFGTAENAESEYNFLHYHLALLELAQGNFTDGFSHFRARFKGGTDWKRMESTQPMWRGEPLNGKSILVTSEQGFGDVLMMARYLPMLKALSQSRLRDPDEIRGAQSSRDNNGAKVTFQIHPALMPLFAGWTSIDEIIPIGSEINRDFDFHIPIFDLPYRFGTTPETIPARVPYLPTPVADEKTDLQFIVQKSREVYAPVAGKSVGVIWAGQPAHQNDKNRSLSLNTIAELFADRDYQFFNLTRDIRPSDLETLVRYPVINLAPLIDDFSDSANVIQQLDLIITCDTATAHLAGGLGKPVWVLLPFAPDWRWGYERSDSPWYPTMRLFRQTKKGDWSDVMARVKDELRILAAETGEPDIRIAAS